MIVVDKTITLDELKKMSEKMYNRLVKAVVDIEKEIMVIDAEMHSDEERLLLEEYESQQKNLWGINIHPFEEPANWIEFDSMINIRPSFGNRTRSVDDPKEQEKIKKLVYKMVVK